MPEITINLHSHTNSFAYPLWTGFGHNMRPQFDICLLRKLGVVPLSH